VVAVYGFINPKSALTAAQQGEALARICTQYEVSTQMLDVEWYTGEPGRGTVLTGRYLASWLRQMSDAAADITQTRGIIYTGHAFWDNPATGPAVGGFGDHDLILADYPGYRASGDPLPRGVAPADWWRQAFRYKAHGPTSRKAGTGGTAGSSRPATTPKARLRLRQQRPRPQLRLDRGGQPLGVPVFAAGPGHTARDPDPTPVTPTPSVPQEDDDMPRMGPFFIQATGADGKPAGRVYLTDGRGMEYARSTVPPGTSSPCGSAETAGYARRVHAPRRRRTTWRRTGPS
jgi:hypothetical protein